jgi:hypothetical protein
VHREQQEQTDSTQPKQKRDRTEQIEERTSSNDGSRHKITRTIKEPAPGVSTDTEERDSGDDSEEEGTWFSLSMSEKIGEERKRVQPTTLKRTKKQTTQKRRESARDRSRSRVRNALKNT